jgi:hypothetical protein
MTWRALFISHYVQMRAEMALMRQENARLRQRAAGVGRRRLTASNPVF